MTETAPNPEGKTYRAIGRFIFEFSQVEYTIRHYVAEEIGLKEEYFTPVLESYDVAMLCDVARAVFAKRRPGEFAARIEEGIKDFLGFNGDRKRVAHGLWVPSNEGGTVHYVARNGLKPHRLQNQAEVLEKRADELNALRARLESAFTAHLHQPVSRRSDPSKPMTSQFPKDCHLDKDANAVAFYVEHNNRKVECLVDIQYLKSEYAPYPESDAKAVERWVQGISRIAHEAKELIEAGHTEPILITSLTLKSARQPKK